MEKQVKSKSGGNIEFCPCCGAELKSEKSSRFHRVVLLSRV